MYKELYDAWSSEKKNDELQPLPKEFYTRLGEYIRQLKEERRMLDEKTTKAKLAIREYKNVQKMAREIITLRQRKASNIVCVSEVVHSEGLAQEEERLFRQVTPSFESYQAVVKEILSGRPPHAEDKTTLKKKVLRFVQKAPAIIGADMRTYGSFKPEDVASIPRENARVLVKQGIAVEIEAKLQSLLIN